MRDVDSARAGSPHGSIATCRLSAEETSATKSSPRAYSDAVTRTRVSSGVAAVSTPIDLAACARRLCAPSNILYSRRFLSRLKQRVRLKESLTPGLFRLEDLGRVKTIYDFDHLFTARVFGFGTADNYYGTQSSNQFLEHIRVPALLVQAKDDPLIPFEVYRHPAFSKNRHLRLLAVEHGGHLGFVAKKKPRLWLDGVLLEWMEQVRNKVAEASVL